MGLDEATMTVRLWAACRHQRPCWIECTEMVKLLEWAAILWTKISIQRDLEADWKLEGTRWLQIISRHRQKVQDGLWLQDTGSISEVIITPLVSSGSLIGQSGSQQQRSIQWSAEGCVGKRRFIFYKDLTFSSLGYAPKPVEIKLNWEKQIFIHDSLKAAHKMSK